MLRNFLAASLFTVLAAGLGHAAIIGVSGPDSSAGTAPAIVAAPTDVLDDVVFNTGMQGFNEAQGVVTSMAYAIDGSGSIAAGTQVDSHMIFLNSQGPGRLTHASVTWTFDNPILGVMSDRRGSREAASSAELGAAGANYTMTLPGQRAAPFASRGLDGGDSYVVADNLLTVTMGVTEPGDWMRVVTGPDGTTVIPLPATLPLALIGLMALAWTAGRRREP